MSNAVAEKEVMRRPLPSSGITIPEEDQEETPFLLRFTEQPKIQGPIAGNQTYLGTTQSGSGEVGDYVNDDA